MATSKHVLTHLQPVRIALAHRGAVKLRLARHVALDRIGVDIRVALDQPLHRRGIDQRDIGAPGRDCLEDVGLAVELQNLRLRQHPVHEVVGIDVRQDRGAHRGSGREQLLEGLVFAFRRDHQPRALDVIGPREGDQLGARGRDGHELDDDVHLAGGDIRNSGCGVLPHVVNLCFVVEQALGEDARHGYVHAGEIALVVLEVPRRVGAAGADDEPAPVERRAQQASRRGLRGRLVRIEQRARGEHGAGGPEAQHVAALREAVHVSSPFPTARPQPGVGKPQMIIKRLYSEEPRLSQP